jgi:hypothetical protein
MENKVLLSDSGVIDVADDFAVHCLTLAQAFLYTWTGIGPTIRSTGCDRILYLMLRDH